LALGGWQLGHVCDEGGLDLIGCGRGGPSVTGCKCREPGSYRGVMDENTEKEKGRTCLEGDGAWGHIRTEESVRRGRALTSNWVVYDKSYVIS
jgi:hypothetical protein